MPVYRRGKFQLPCAPYSSRPGGRPAPAPGPEARQLWTVCRIHGLSVPDHSNSSPNPDRLGPGRRTAPATRAVPADSRRSVPAASAPETDRATGASTGRHCRKTTSVARTAHARPACAGRRWPGRSCGLPPECSRSFKLQSLGLELTLRPTRNNPSGPPPAPATVTVTRTPTAGQPVPVTQMPIIRDRLRTQQ